MQYRSIKPTRAFQACGYVRRKISRRAQRHVACGTFQADRNKDGISLTCATSLPYDPVKWNSALSYATNDRDVWNVRDGRTLRTYNISKNVTTSLDPTGEIWRMRYCLIRCIFAEAIIFLTHIQLRFAFFVLYWHNGHSIPISIIIKFIKIFIYKVSMITYVIILNAAIEKYY